jgi:hypothetical protein
MPTHCVNNSTQVLAAIFQAQIRRVVDNKMYLTLFVPVPGLVLTHPFEHTSRGTALASSCGSKNIIHLLSYCLN